MNIPLTTDQLYFGNEVSIPKYFDNPNADKPFSLSEQLLHTHMAIFGGTRMGKSKLFEQICRELIRKRRGFCFIDPHSDTAEDLTAFLTRERDKLGIFENNIHYLNPYEKLFTFDPFHYQPDPTDPVSYTRQGYLEWLDAKVKDVERIITRVMGESEAESQKQVRMHRWMRDVLYAIGIMDEEGNHLGLHDALILLQPDDPRYPDVFNRVAPLLTHRPILGPADDGEGIGPDVLTDLETMARVRDPSRREAWVESSINRLRLVLSPIVRLLFEPRGDRIELHKIIASNGIIVAPLGKRKRFHQSDGHLIASMLIREMSDAVTVVHPDHRSQYSLFIDEAQNFIGDDMKHLFKESGKYKLSIGLAVQSMDNLKSGDIDLCETVLGMCGVRITFKQQNEEIAELLARNLCYPLLDYTKLKHEVYQPDGYDFVALPSVSVGQQSTRTLSRSITASQAAAMGHTVGSGNSRSETEGTGHSLAHGKAVADSLARNYSIANGTSYADSITEGETHGQSITAGTAKALQITDGTSQALSDARTNGITTGESTTTGSQSAHQTGHTNNKSTTDPARLIHQRHEKGLSHQRGEADNESSTLSHSDSATVNKASTTNHTLTDQRSTNHSSATTDTENRSTALSDSRSHSRTHTKGGSQVITNGLTQGKTLTASDTQSFSTQQSVALTASETASDSITLTDSLGHTLGEGESEGESLSLSYGVTPIARQRKVLQDTGKLATDITTQRSKLTTLLQSLLKQQCLVCVGQTNFATVINVAGVYDEFAHLEPAWKHGAVTAFKQFIFDLHPYFFDRDSTLLVDYFRQVRLNVPATPDDNPMTP